MLLEPDEPAELGKRADVGDMAQESVAGKFALRVHRLGTADRPKPGQIFLTQDIVNDAISVDEKLMRPAAEIP
jgi:hypothetical protein